MDDFSFDDSNWGSDILGSSTTVDPGMSAWDNPGSVIDSPSWNMGNFAFGDQNQFGATGAEAGGSSIESLLSGLGGIIGSPLTKGLLGVGSGIVGAGQAKNLQDLAKQAFAKSDPFGPQRAQYQQQLSALMANPSSIFQDAGFKASMDQGLQGVSRTMAAQGYLGSGNEAIELEKYGQSMSTDYMNQRIAQLSQLSGSGISPNFGPGLSGYAQGMDTLSGSLGSAAFGLNQAFGGPSAASSARPGGFNAASGEAAGYLGIGNSAASLYKGFGGTVDSSVTNAMGGAADVLGFYQGIEKGGVTGYGQAAGDALKLSGMAFGDSALSTLGGEIAAPLTAYNTVKNWQSGATGQDALGGFSTGASIGSLIMPGVGTLVGGAIGAGVGALSSAFGSGKKDPESGSWTGYADAFKKDPSIALQVQNPYLELAGLFDSRKGQITGQVPFYQKYGRMGEQKFTNDMIGQIQSAISSGKVKQGDDPAKVYQSVVQPWINSMGAWDDPNKQAQQGLLYQMVNQYMSGTAGQSWKAVGGDRPFQNATPNWGGVQPASSGAANSMQFPLARQLSTYAAPGKMSIGPSSQQLGALVH
jgi:hypothetical protein